MFFYYDFMNWKIISLVSSLALAWCAPSSCTDRATNTSTQTTLPSQVGEKIGRYTCLVQEWIHQVIQTQNSTWIPQFFFTPNQDTETVFSDANYQTPYRLENSLENGQLNIYFLTSSNRLDNGDIQDLDQLISYINNLDDESITLTLEGFADARWTLESNLALWSNRIIAVRNYLESRINKTVYYTQVSHGETLSHGNTQDLLSLRADRRVSISLNTDVISRWLSSSPADAYIVDASGSMWEMLSDDTSRWSKVADFDFPDGSSIYTFSLDHIRHQCAGSINSQRISGKTPLYGSIIDVINSWNYNWKTITILTDGEDTWETQYSLHDVISLAQQNNITLNVIWIGSSNTEILTQIAQQTWGSFFFEQ